jgi:hypothetical protein
MEYWEYFWTFSILVAGGAFAFITVVVTIKGGRDLREMFSRLIEQKKHDRDS